jgi:hypothetical protein
LTSGHAVAQTIPPAPHYDMRIRTSNSILEPGDTVQVTLEVLRNGQPGYLGLPIIKLAVESAPGVVQDQSKPVLLPAAPIEERPGGSVSTVTYHFTAGAPGGVTIYASVNGEGYAEGADGLPFYFFTSVTARSGALTVLDEQDTFPVSIPEPVTLVLFGTGLAALAAAAASRRR